MLQKIIPLLIAFSFNTFLQGQPKSIKISPDSLEIISKKYKVDQYELKSAYFQYLYLIEKNVLVKNHKSLIRELPVYANVAYETGDICNLEKERLLLDFHNIENEINNYTYDISIAENQIKLLLNTVDDIIPSVDSLIKYTSTEIINFIQFQMTNQPDSLFVDFLINENHLLSFKKLESQLEYYYTVLLPFANNVKKETLIKLKNEEIDHFYYYKLIEEVLNINKNYLSLLNDYNQLTIQIEKHYANY